MKSILYAEMALTRDLPKYGLRRGDVVRPVERHLGPDGTIGFSVEVLGATGRTLAVIAVPGAVLERLRKDEVLSVRTFSGNTASLTADTVHPVTFRRLLLTETGIFVRGTLPIPHASFLLPPPSD